jgi:molybdopterin-guanine dinucleotide biosynthesis protein A
MGTDKAALAYAGVPQVLRGHRVLAEVCKRVLVSVRRDQARSELFAAFELVIDRHADTGPAAGLLAAWDTVPGAALLVLAVDLPRVDAAVLERLIAARDTQALATAFVHANGMIEPLCTIWEPTAEEKLRVGARQPPLSLRKVLEMDRTRRVALKDTASLQSVNTPEDYAAVSSSFTAT